eukprot:TRINITY_DN34834_c0_g2_i2.p1 TRINITY_DN34834_c0_g2~~TRINITY_DN34834_c0_g2_i2.p1  ORF type:complete len:131 (+),score=6.96 TRINITY_DN34834_c0_g2_i2:222-614(+)
MRNIVKSSCCHFLLFFSFFFLLNLAVSVSHFRYQLDHERHNKVIHVESPGIFKSKVRFDILIASIESCSKEFFFFSFNKEFKQFFDNFLIVRLLSSFNSISVDLIFFGKIDTLFIFSILSVEISCNTSEF